MADLLVFGAGALLVLALYPGRAAINAGGVEVNEGVHNEEMEAPAQPPDRPLDRRYKILYEANMKPGGYAHGIRDMKTASFYKGNREDRYEPEDKGKWSSAAQAYVERGEL